MNPPPFGRGEEKGPLDKKSLFKSCTTARRAITATKGFLRVRGSLKSFFFEPELDQANQTHFFGPAKFDFGRFFRMLWNDVRKYVHRNPNRHNGNGFFVQEKV